MEDRRPDTWRGFQLYGAFLNCQIALAPKIFSRRSLQTLNLIKAGSALLLICVTHCGVSATDHLPCALI